MGEELEREVLALAARGLLTNEQIDAVPSEAFTGAPRLLAWICIRRVRRGVPAMVPVGAGRIDAQELIARTPAVLQGVVAARLARPRFESAADAKSEILAMGQRLQRARVRSTPRAPDPFFEVRLMLATVPRLDMPIDAWSELLRETEAELDAAERLTTLDPRAVDQLLRLTQDDTDEGDDRR